MLKAIRHVCYTELTLSWRRSQEWLYPLAFFTIVICLFPLAFTPDPAFLQKYVPGCVWIAALLASLLSVENVFLTDMEDGYLEQLLLARTPLTLVMGAKIAAHWLVTELPLIILTPILCVMFQLPLATTLALCLSLLLGTPVLTLIGSLCVALSLGLRQHGVFLGLLILPLVTPVLIFGVTIVQQSGAGLPVAGALSFLAGLSVLAVTLVPWAIAQAVRVSMDD